MSYSLSAMWQLTPPVPYKTLYKMMVIDGFNIVGVSVSSHRLTNINYMLTYIQNMIGGILRWDR
jgi:hypothetical protein